MSGELTAFLGEQLRPLAARSGFSVEADGADVVVVGEDGRESRNGAATILDETDDPRSSVERVATVARAVLGHVQDVIARETGRPWPGADTELPLPDAAVEGEALIAWFGDRAAPAWRSDRMPLPA